MTLEESVNPKDELVNLIKANTKIIQIISYETLMIHAHIAKAASELEREFYMWNRVDGIKKWDSEKAIFTTNNDDSDKWQPKDAFVFFSNHENIILLLEDFHPDLTDNQPHSIKRLRNVAMDNNKKRTLILSQPFRLLPKELEKEVHIMELPCPSRGDLTEIFKR